MNRKDESASRRNPGVLEMFWVYSAEASINIFIIMVAGAIYHEYLIIMFSNFSLLSYVLSDIMINHAVTTYMNAETTVRR